MFNDVFARVLMASGKSRSYDYQHLLEKYQNQGFFLNLSDELKKYISRKDMAKEYQKRGLELDLDDLGES